MEEHIQHFQHSHQNRIMRGVAASACTLRPGPPGAVRSKSNGPDRLSHLPTRPLSAPHLHLRRSPEPTHRRLPLMASSPSAAATGSGGSFPEMNSVDDFAAVTAPRGGGRVSVVGFGSLLSGEHLTSAAAQRWIPLNPLPESQSGARGARSRSWRGSGWRRCAGSAASSPTPPRSSSSAASPSRPPRSGTQLLLLECALQTVDAKKKQKKWSYKLITIWNETIESHVSQFGMEL